ncbi:MAG: hypothetical protein MUC99_09635 [Anaerolineae bacterium]|jgi:hypothetical protein|nr:hypothetical protein [Anaerolineae bacterium]
MNTRLRLLVVFLGGVLVAATFTFDRWFPPLVGDQNVILFPELPEALQEAFDALPSDQREAYLALRERDTVLAARMAAAALQAPRLAPEDAQDNPNRSGQVEIDTAEFEAIDPTRSATGTLRLYEMPDGSRYVWLEEFSVVPSAGLRLFLSALTVEEIEALARQDEGENEYKLTLEDLLLDPLRFDVGNQAYDIPREADLSRYNSILLYSTEFDLLWAIAEF